VAAITVNGRDTEAQNGETILSALTREGIHVPTLCHVEGLTPTGACRLCVVEVNGRLVPSCAYPVAEGMTIQTHTPRVMTARKTIVELLLANHPDDCLYCERSGSCQLQDLAEELGVRRRRFTGDRNRQNADISSPSIIRDPAKCILCGKCVRVCEEVQGVAAIDFIGRGSRSTVGTAFDEGLNVSTCINCGQCVVTCPTGALREQSHIERVTAALADPELTVVIQHAPSVSVTLAEEFGAKPGADVCGAMTAVLRRIGFDRVFDTSFAADLTILEEGSELVHRVQTGGPLPLLTSCSPGWVKFVEQFYPELIPNVSTCKSPQQMLGAVIKTFFAEREGLAPEKIFSVSVMPCTAKKFEADRPEHARDGVPDVDAVLTTRELARLIRERGLTLDGVEPEAADSPFGERSSAGKLFGATGGVAEAATRSAYYLLTGEELTDPVIRDLRGMKPIKETHVKVGELEVGVAVVSGLSAARRILDQVRAGRSDLHMIEVMTCPGGCINGGGQPYNADREAAVKRMQRLYSIDNTEAMRASHHNPEVKRLYEEFLGEPLGHRSHELLHTTYTPRATKRGTGTVPPGEPVSGTHDPDGT
jgi:NADH-quinone oxidoreductase subunit G/NADP-reducing hydrogenase subunit HndD